MNKSSFYLTSLLIGVLAIGCNQSTKKESRWCNELPRPINDSLKTQYSNYWFEVYKVQDGIYAISEPYQWQEVISYLIIGDNFALLFDTGNGIGNIKQVVKSITSLPVRVLNSHSHFDHVGGNADFDFIYGMDTEFTRGRKTGRTHEQVADEVSPPALCKPLPEGVKAEDHHIRAYEINEIVSEGYIIDMGSRKLKVISIPGHTPDAIGLLDEQNGLLWTGDTFYKGPIWLFAKETDLVAYKNSIARLAALAPSLRYLLPAHNSPLAEPHLLVDLNKALDDIERGAAEGTVNKDGRKVYSFPAFSILMAESVINEEWQSLFDGKTLNGWHALPGGTWNVEDGILVGRSDQKEERHGILVSDKQYKNFEIEIVYKAVKGNSGLYFRADEIGDVYGVLGFQAEIDPVADAGGLYETGGRQWVSQPDAEDVKKYYKGGDWNSMSVRAVNGDITVIVNGTTVATLHNDPGRKQGHFGLQLHGGQEMLVMFKMIRVKELQ